MTTRSPELKALQSQKIHSWKPWQNSTGAKTPAGKKRSAQNARLTPNQKQLRRICKILGLPKGFEGSCVRSGADVARALAAAEVSSAGINVGSPGTRHQVSIRRLKNGGYTLRTYGCCGLFEFRYVVYS